MKLAKADRAGPPLLEEDCSRPSRRQPLCPPEAESNSLTADESALSILLQKHADVEFVTITEDWGNLDPRLHFRFLYVRRVVKIVIELSGTGGRRVYLDVFKVAGFYSLNPLKKLLRFLHVGNDEVAGVAASELRVHPIVRYDMLLY